MAINGYTGAKVFTATKARDREDLGDAITAWLAKNPNVEVVHTVTLQSSDTSFHCLTCFVFYRQAEKGAPSA